MRIPSPNDQVGSGDFVTWTGAPEWSKSGRFAVISSKLVTCCTAENAGLIAAPATDEFVLATVEDTLHADGRCICESRSDL